MVADASSSPRVAPSLEDFTNIFVLSSTSNSGKVLSEVPKALDGDSLRQRRTHQKSRMGCESCRKRKVKCSPETPCASCTRRGERCQRHIGRNGVTAIPPVPTQTPFFNFGSTDASVNLIHLKLFHHFHTCTRQTLLLSPEIWGHALQLCFEFEFLMNAILCVAARHLAIIRPADSTYSIAAASQSCRASSQLRYELSKGFNSIHIDAFIATTLLLQYEIWTSTDLDLPQYHGVITYDRIFEFSSSLKQVFIKTVPLACGQPSVLMQHIRQSPINILARATQISNVTLARYQHFFSYRRPLNWQLLSFPLLSTQGTDEVNFEPWQLCVPQTQGVPDQIEDGYVPVIDHLCLIMSFLPEARSPNSVSTESPILPGLARYIHSFPVLCSGPFASMVQRSDPHALLLLYHFYRAVRILLPSDQYWWAHKRATVSEAALKQWLARESAEQAEASV
ncbi:hypothetical protein BJ170DRAFT_176849 [Xylariales sp. AK1849]|nr:hypothetical protein BJ170DRAFT_176849 [Xylariales sp. AK1849]